ncbi:Uncharacterised protein [Mycobacteroides abscessus subsp. abscessus]|nr:Uncharacterised protein [Mycobacteroides abscessus]SHT13267.1 Uncharacterised protein [Mycobacteroides abscessus subsp. abscessus]SHV95408.1 Uncharacterised protein [Mycobacteroides abscessus subsp. abscessus]SIM23166.1 Uncharacterised protein [Mycobacteroides abscessus subsp. abscessus]
MSLSATWCWESFSNANPMLYPRRASAVSTIQPPTVTAVSTPSQGNASAGAVPKRAPSSGTKSRQLAARIATETTESTQ